MFDPDQEVIDPDQEVIDQEFIKKKRGGRPRGSRARIPAGHVGPEGLAAMLGVSPTTIPAMERRGDTPPRSPLAGRGKRQRQIWRICDVQAYIQAPPAPVPAAPPSSVEWDWRGPTQPAQSTSTVKRRPGRPRGNGKFSK